MAKSGKPKRSDNTDSGLVDLRHLCPEPQNLWNRANSWKNCQRWERKFCIRTSVLKAEANLLDRNKHRGEKILNVNPIEKNGRNAGEKLEFPFLTSVFWGKQQYTKQFPLLPEKNKTSNTIFPVNKKDWSVFQKFILNKFHHPYCVWVCLVILLKWHNSSTLTIYVC